MKRARASGVAEKMEAKVSSDWPEITYEQALAAYETAVLNAVREVRNALVDYQSELHRREALASRGVVVPPTLSSSLF